MTHTVHIKQKIKRSTPCKNLLSYVVFLRSSGECHPVVDFVQTGEGQNLIKGTKSATPKRVRKITQALCSSTGRTKSSKSESHEEELSITLLACSAMAWFTLNVLDNNAVVPLISRPIVPFSLVTPNLNWLKERMKADTPTLYLAITAACLQHCNTSNYL